jgi:hypothetical protein
LDCIVHSPNRYLPYPFDNLSGVAPVPAAWSVVDEHMNAVAISWIHSTPPSPPNAVPRAPLCKSAEYRALPWDGMVTQLLSALSRTHGRVAFCISDHSYAADMIDSVASMAWDTMEFKDSFFLVALDALTYELACDHGVPVISVVDLESGRGVAKREAGEAALRDVVMHTKFSVSKKLLDLNVNFFFFEMDVFFVRSPQPLLASQSVDFLVSSHQNNPRAGNIGVYSINANERTREFLQDCLTVSQLVPEQHDQRTMMNLAAYATITRNGATTAGWNDVPPVPRPTHPITFDLVDPHVIVASTHLVPTQATIAVHPLDVKPLKSPHAKKMLAKEQGFWCGAARLSPYSL